MDTSHRGGQRREFEARKSQPAPARPKEEKANSNSAEPPTLSLPKGGGAIRGIGEKFEVNSANGTGSFGVPIALPPGRSGFGPQLSLSYNSGSGNGPFGLGWGLSVPSISRKTEKGLPRYRDAEDSDLFILSGAEDLVPSCKYASAKTQSAGPGGGAWSPDLETVVLSGAAYMVRRYRPRVEGLFARIERWTNQSTGDAYWQSVTKDNITSVYGKDENSRVFDPSDHTRVFQWLLSETYDDRGNWIVYGYAPEDSNNLDLNCVNEANRTQTGRSANRYLKTIQYGNPVSRLATTDAAKVQWMFQVVFDYGEGHYSENPPDSNGTLYAQASATPAGTWPARQDPFSTYRPGFEVRTYRLCQRVLVFHCFDELPQNPCLVKSTEFYYDQNPVLTYLDSVVQNGFSWQAQAAPAAYLKKSYPPLQFTYNQPVIDPNLHEVDPGSLENLPEGAGGNRYEWVDLDSEGSPGILSRQNDGWYYKRNLSPLPCGKTDGISMVSARFAPLEKISALPSWVGGGAHGSIMDLSGDGRKSLVEFNKPTPGFYERKPDGQWDSFIPFASNPNVAWNNPNLRMIDLNGDGFPDILLTEDDVLRWYPSLTKEGFGPSSIVRKPFYEDRGPALVFADPAQSIFLADMTGDGLTDIVRIRSGEVCYWPNMGYGNFGPKLSMDRAPSFDSPDLFDPRRIRLADIDGSGTTDILYLGNDSICFWFNQSGSSFGPTQSLPQWAPSDRLSSVGALDLMGNGTACLVWSSPLPADSDRPLRYIDLMGGQKPHLLTGIDNQMGGKTVITYAPSTKFYLRDLYAGTPWATRLPFPVQVVERVDSYDLINHNRFVTGYTFHHGYYDGVEREFRGFGRVDQWDTEEFGAMNADGNLPEGDNFDAASNVPPVRVKTWFHTGAYFGQGRIARHFANEYYQGDGQARTLPETVLDPGVSDETLTAHEEREACRALKGRVLRREIYADDGTSNAPQPYGVEEHAYNVTRLQPVLGAHPPGLEAPHGVFYTYEREVLAYHYERNPQDPRIGHQMTLAVDNFGNVLQSASFSYPRRQVSILPAGLSAPANLDPQSRVWATYKVSDFFNNDLSWNETNFYRVGIPTETREYEVTGLAQPTGGLFLWNTLSTLLPGAVVIAFEEAPTVGTLQNRLVGDSRILYWADDLSGPLGLGTVQSHALVYQTYQMALTYGLIQNVFQSTAYAALGAEALDTLAAPPGGYVSDACSTTGLPPVAESFTAGNLWVPSGATVYDPEQFYLPTRFIDPFGNITTIIYDNYTLLLLQVQDALGNLTTAGTRDPAGNITSGLDYRVLQPALVMDPNQNQAAAAFDALGHVVGTAVMGKPAPAPIQGDILTGFIADLNDAVIDAHLADPLANPGDILQQATTRLVYDLFAYQRTQGSAQPQPMAVYTLGRETHAADLGINQQTQFQHAFSYSDGFGREIQKKIQTDPDPLELSEPNSITATPRWIGSGWVILNNKGKPARQYEPFFSATNQFEFANRVGVGSILFYDPLERVVATLHPNHTYEKTVFNAWEQDLWDANDTVLLNPAGDPDAGGFFSRLPQADYLPTWYGQRSGGALGTLEQAAASQTTVQAGTFSRAYLDGLGRVFLTLADNGPDANGNPQKFPTAVQMDIQGNQVSVTDAKGREVVRGDYAMLKNQLHQAGMEAGEKWSLNDATGKSFCSWATNVQNFRFRQVYDALHRPAQLFLSPNSGTEALLQWMVYGEQASNPTSSNLLGKPYLVYDQGGLATHGVYDFKGNLLDSSRQLAADYQGSNGSPFQVDWTTVSNGTDTAASKLEKKNPADASPETFTAGTTYDALNRIVTRTTPDNSVTRYGYNVTGLLNRVDVCLQGAQGAGAPVWTPFVTAITYNPKGQRASIQYGNQAQTAYAYDPLTFRLAELTTTRPTAGSTTGAADTLQGLSYTYDPAGNITESGDAAQQTLFFQNAAVTSNARYAYDPLYRLTNASGREHIGQNQAWTQYDNWNDASDMGLPQPGDGGAMAAYQEAYEYDPAGNFMSVSHQASGNNWTRNYAYNEPSLLDPTQVNNRLSHTQAGGFTYPYQYDGHGNTITMPHLPVMQWDCHDQLQSTSRQAAAGNITPEMTYYVYDGGGQRVRKVTQSQAALGQTPSRASERLYLGGYEVYREYDNAGNITLERQSLHVMDDKNRIALVETRTAGKDGSPAQLIRYQYSNHLGSAALELDGQAQMISYEEYFPYGATSYQSVDATREVPEKRYRYTGMERDEENGFNYHGARYYAPWLGRWINPDPMGLQDGLDGYLYTHGNPVNNTDRNGMETNPRAVKQWDDAKNKKAPVGGPLPAAAEQVKEQARQIAYSNSKKGLDPHGNPVRQYTVEPPGMGEKIARGFLDLTLLLVPVVGDALELPSLVELSLGVQGDYAADANLLNGMQRENLLKSGADLRSSGTEISSFVKSVSLNDPSGVVSFSSESPRMGKSVGAAATKMNVLELEVTHQINFAKGLPDAIEMTDELNLHREAIEDILNEEGLSGLQLRAKEYQAFRNDLVELRSQINSSLGSAGEGRAWSHYPDMVLGADPFAIRGSVNARINSIIGRASRDWAGQIIEMNPSDSRAWRLSLKITLVR